MLWMKRRITLWQHCVTGYRRHFAAASAAAMAGMGILPPSIIGNSCAFSLGKRREWVAFLSLVLHPGLNGRRIFSFMVLAVHGRGSRMAVANPL